MKRSILGACALFGGFLLLSRPVGTAAPDAVAPGAVLSVGFGEADITPWIGDKPVFLAGFGQNRKATGIHDPLFARAVVLDDGTKRLALASVDLVGFFLPGVESVRRQLAGFDYVLVSSTHNHEGPDTLGLWGPNPFTSGIDPEYQAFVEKQIVKAVRAAEAALQPARGLIGKTQAPELLHDGREPWVKHDELVALRFDSSKSATTPLGIIVQWNCHPETLDSRNTLLSADYVASTVEYVRQRFGCPVVYFTGTVGGLMTSLHVPIKDDQGRDLQDGTFEKTKRFGTLVGKAAEKALSQASPLKLVPLAAKHRDIYLPLDNKVYVLGRQLGVLKRPAYHWMGDRTKAEPLSDKVQDKPLCMKSEVGWLRLGDLEVACIPGEIYPELVLDQVQDPVDAGADFPDAPIEPAIYKQLTSPHRMIIGLANDEIGYIIPRRQWDEKPPYCYGRKKSQYGEINSLGPQTAPLLCTAFRELTRSKP